MSFFLVRLEPDGTGNMTDVPIPDYGPYEKGSEAAKVAKTLTDQLGTKVQPRRISQAPDWRARQAQRLADGTLKQLPAKWDLKPIEDHFAHLDEIKYPGMICFTENEQLGIIDRVTAITPGRYLSRFYEGISDSRRRALIALIDPSGEIHFARTPEEITRVYIEGPSSCMDGRHDFSALPCHPCAVYGAGDLAVAYTLNKAGRIQSRSVCWPEKKLFGRIYGDISRMRRQLESEGFTGLRDEDEDRCEDFIGARIAKVTFDEGHFAVMPYFDDIAVVIDSGDHWVTVQMGPSRLPQEETHPTFCYSGSTSGYSPIQRWCPKSKEYHNSKKFRFVKGVNEEWSLPAISIDGFQCDETNEYWPSEYCVRLHDDGFTVSREWFEQYGAVCPITQVNCRKNKMVEHDGMLVHPGAISTKRAA